MHSSSHPPTPRAGEGAANRALTHGLQHRSHGMTPSGCPNCGFASLFLDPFLLSRMRVGVVSGTRTQVEVSNHKLQHRSHGMTPSRCPNCGFASLFLDPFLLSRMRVGVWDTSTLSCKSISVKQGDGTWRANPPFSGNGPNGQAPSHCGTCSSLRGAFNVLPVAELLVVDARPSAVPSAPSN